MYQNCLVSILFSFICVLIEERVRKAYENDIQINFKSLNYSHAFLPVILVGICNCRLPPRSGQTIREYITHAF